MHTHKHTPLLVSHTHTVTPGHVWTVTSSEEISGLWPVPVPVPVPTAGERSGLWPVPVPVPTAGEISGLWPVPVPTAGERSGLWPVPVPVPTAGERSGLWPVPVPTAAALYLGRGELLSPLLLCRSLSSTVGPDNS